MSVNWFFDAIYDSPYRRLKVPEHPAVPFCESLQTDALPLQLLHRILPHLVHSLTLLDFLWLQPWQM